MATLVSPGVDVQIIDESIYGESGLGTVPLIFIATANNKATPSGTGIAPGTLPENAGQLYTITSQRELLQTFGDPKFYYNAGTPVPGHELNEYGLLAAYQYLGIANRAYVLRGDLKTEELEPSVFEPRDEALSGTYWLNLSETNYGYFTSNGSSVPGLAWDSKSPLIVNNLGQMESIVIGEEPFASSSTDVITTSGTYSMSINGTEIEIVHSGTNITLGDIVMEINNAGINGITARAVRLSGASYILITNSQATAITLGDGDSTSLLDDLGLGNVTYTLQPKRSVGVEGDLAVVSYLRDNIVYQKVRPLDKDGNEDVNSISMWWIVGSANWKAATPTVVTGSGSPTLPLVSGDILYIANGQGSSAETVTVEMQSAHASISSIVSEINNALDNAALGFQQDGTTPLSGGAVDLPIMALEVGGALRIVNFAGGDVLLSEDAANSSQGILASVGLPATLVRGNRFFNSAHTNIPQNSVVGDVWQKTTKPNLGADYVVQIYSRASGQWSTLSAPLYASDDAASTTLGLNVVAGTLYTQYNLYGDIDNPIASSTVKRYLGNQTVTVQGTKTPGTGSFSPLKVNDMFVIEASQLTNTGFVVNTKVFTLPASLGDSSGNVSVENVAILINDASSDLPGVVASVVDGTLQVSNTNNLSLTIGYTDPSTGLPVANPTGRDPLNLLGIGEGTYSNWEVLSYEPNTVEPTTDPSEGTLWYNEDFRVDIMVNDPNQGDEWFGFKNVYPNTDPNGPIIGGSAPLTQTDGTPLVENDIWIDGSDLENYPKMYRWRSTLNQWERIDTTDQTTPFGIIFADARSNSSGAVDGSEQIEDMLVSDYVDPDAPDPRTYPGGMLLFNTRYSTYNVKEWKPNYFDEYVGQELDDSPGFQFSVGVKEFPVDTITTENTGRWVTVSGNRVDGRPYMGRKAQRIMVIRAMAEQIVSNQDIRSEALFYNLIAAPGYPELIDEMVTLNTDRKETAFIIGDTPARLEPNGTSIQNWATNTANSPSTDDEGLTTANTYVGLYYPWGLGTNLDGAEVVIPPSAMALRTYAYNDQVSYPWFAPAGFTRGVVTNAASVGYITSEGEYQPSFLNNGLRDVLYLNNINPIVFKPNRGLLIHGQKTLHPVASALDRVNVARLANYLKYYLAILAEPFLFEPNDKITRDEVVVVFERWLGNLISLRAITDFAVLCDTSNNTPARIDRNELWIDVAIIPVKSIEYIYIPVRIRNTGDNLSFESAQ